VDFWIRSYLELLCDFVPIEKLNSAIQTHHIKQSANLFSLIVEGRSVKHQNIKQQDVLRNMLDFLDHSTDYQLNTDAFLISTGNLKHEQILNLFKLIGINLNAALLKNEQLSKFIELSEKREKGSEKSFLYHPIDDLVLRRNIIAHGDRIDNRLSRTIILEYIDFLGVYCRAMFEILQENYIREESIHLYEPITVVHNVWNKSILGCKLERCTIRVNDFLIIKSAEEHFFKRPIMELQIDKVTYESVTITEPTDVAIRVAPNIAKNATFYLKKANL
jgi:hypothetical protein